MTGNGNYTTHKNADDWGIVYGIVLTTLHVLFWLHQLGHKQILNGL